MAEKEMPEKEAAEKEKKPVKPEENETKPKTSKNEKPKKPKEPKDKKKKKKPNRVAKWFRDLKSEFKKVVWPTKKQVLNNTFVVLMTMLVSSIFVGALDFGLLRLFKFLLGIGE